MYGIFIQAWNDHWHEEIARYWSKHTTHKLLLNGRLLGYKEPQSSKAKVTFAEVLTWRHYLNLSPVFNGLGELIKHIYAFT